MLTAIIVSWNTRAMLQGCLQSLLMDLRRAAEQEHLPDFAEVVVVDSASTDGSAEMVRREFPAVHLIACETNIGYVKANNIAMRRAVSKEWGAGTAQLQIPTPHAPISIPHFLWLLNPDTVVQPNATRTLLNFMHAHPRCGLCGPQLQNADGSLQHGAFELPGLAQLAIDVFPRLQARLRNTKIDGRYAPAQYAGGVPFQIGAPLGAAMLARVAAVQETGLLDDGFEMYCEEMDWAARMHKSNWEVWCVPNAVVTHFGGASSSQAQARTEQIKWQSRQRYYAKHYAPLKLWLARKLVPQKFRVRDTSA